MYHTIDEFIGDWENESNSTQVILDVLTDESLNQQVTSENRTLGRIAWHVVTSVHEMLSRARLTFEAAEHESPLPSSAKEIANSYRSTSQNMIKAIKDQWSNESIKEMNDMYSQQWPNGITLSVLIKHQTHHRGQMTVLMRQAGLKVPGIYGPSREEWPEAGMEPPLI